MEKSTAVTFESHGAKIRGVFYRASGAGRFSTVVLCHGFPGNDSDVQGLGQRLMKQGWNQSLDKLAQILCVTCIPVQR